MQFNF